MEIRRLRTFETITRTGTVTAAANELGIAPSSVSEQIRVLEKSVGVTLFERGPRGMTLTSAGERMRDWARRLLDQAEQARREVAEAAPPLRLGALESIAATHVPSVLARLAARRPDLRVQVAADGNRDDLLAAVVAGRLDAALLLDTGARLGELGFEPPPTALAFVDLEPIGLTLVAAPDHPLGDRVRITGDDLRGHRLLVNVAACSFRLAGDRLLGTGVEQVRVGSVAVIRAWAEQGLGVALLPTFAVADQLASGKLIRLALDAPDLTLRLVWRPDRESVPGLREVLYAAASPAQTAGPRAPTAETPAPAPVAAPTAPAAVPAPAPAPTPAVAPPARR
ncbi:LysR family transcriptional regulator [Embleya sp. NPDC050154]|uniref:LysR family transcriptional regulator n=1 Tax=Embleya sp. NPDC050154 TaxID=3363988 RepID=UPI0037B6560D